MNISIRITEQSHCQSNLSEKPVEFALVQEEIDVGRHLLRGLVLEPCIERVTKFA
jgi:hypothetical protein